MNQLPEDDMKDELDLKTDVKLTFSKNQTQYVSFDGRYFDDELIFDDEINLLAPPYIEPSNVYQFELILLASESVPKDYVVGWGVFPLVNSDFQLNEGKFKVPLVFGGVNVAYDKYGRIEQQYKHDLDSWLCNLYFEVKRIKMSSIKVHPETNELYHFHPEKALQDAEYETPLTT